MHINNGETEIKNTNQTLLLYIDMVKRIRNRLTTSGTACPILTVLMGAPVPHYPPSPRWPSLTAWPNGLATLVDNASNPGAVVGAVDFNGAWVGSMDFIDDV